ncbi:MAG: ComEA family DNA-binding protein [Isosphaeraceae bacterium]
MFIRKRQSLQQGSLPRSRVTFRWTWSAGIRVMLAAAVLLAGVALRSTISRRGIDSATTFNRAPDLVLDPNTAPASVLEALPHLGPSLVKRLIAEREVRPFESTEDLCRRVRGLGPATMARLGPYLRIRSREDPAPGQPRLAQMPNSPSR